MNFNQYKLNIKKIKPNNHPAKKELKLFNNRLRTIINTGTKAIDITHDVSRLQNDKSHKKELHNNKTIPVKQRFLSQLNIPEFNMILS